LEPLVLWDQSKAPNVERNLGRKNSRNEQGMTTKTIIVRDYPDPRSFEEFKVDVSTTSDDDDDDGAKIRVERQQSNTSPWQFLYDLFLPVGYPDSVPPTYLSYQFYDSLQGLCSYLRGVWCTAAVLEAAGVGDATAHALAVAVTWMTKDGLGIIGGLVYSYNVSHLFDGHVKEFRLLADVMNDIGLFLDMLAPYVARKHLLYLSGTAVLCKTICGISAGATKGSITQHFAIAGNMADLNAKEATQETLMSLLGMILGVGAAKVVNNTHRSSSWTIFIILTAVHVWANWRGVMLLRMRTLNRARADLVLAEWIRRSVLICKDGDNDPLKKEKNSNEEQQQLIGKKEDQATVAVTTATTELQLPTPDDVRESLWSSFHSILFPERLQLGVPLSQLLIRSHPSAAVIIMDELNNLDKTIETTKDATAKHYVLIFDATKNQIQVSFLKDASEETILRAFLHARLIQEGAAKDAAKKMLNVHFGGILQSLSTAGWDVDRFYLDCSKCRSSWTRAEPAKRKRE
jgi:Vitamin B6 photo-protection and homoeostasis